MLEWGWREERREKKKGYKNSSRNRVGAWFFSTKSKEELS
jgi:hypothetical protein